MKKIIIILFISMLMTITIFSVVGMQIDQTKFFQQVHLEHQPPIYEKVTETTQVLQVKEIINNKQRDFGFLGITDTGWTPPDPIIAAGPEHLVVMTNGAIAFFQKDGTKDFQDEIEDSYGFWGSVGATNFVFDPEIIYDPHTNRFMAMANERSPTAHSYFLLAISDDADPNGAWYKYRFDVTSLAGSGIDSPNICVDSQAVYLSADFFTGGEKYLVYILEKEPLLSGSVGITNSMLITGSQSYGFPVIYGVAPAMYMIEHFEGYSNTKVRLHAITDPLGTPQKVTYDVTVPSYSPPENAPSKGTNEEIETFDSRFWSCEWRDGSLWATHHQGSSRVMARWYEIKTNNWPNSGIPELIQSGDIDPGPTIRTFFTAIASDGYGNAALCFARSSPTEYISIARCVRESTDPLGEMQEVEIIKESTAPYNYWRWGDYSGISCDPSDNRSFWMFGEYTDGGGSWKTWISKCSVSLGPDLDCDGDLAWVDLKPGSLVSGSFTVQNIGDTESLLDWEIESYPDWGTWMFNPESGLDLTPEDGIVTIDVDLVVPDEPETEFTGEVILINIEDPDDTCIIDVSLATPVSQFQSNQQIPRFMQSIIERYPILRQLLGL